MVILQDIVSHDLKGGSTVSDLLGSSGQADWIHPADAAGVGGYKNEDSDRPRDGRSIQAMFPMASL
jgi:hypothetical protein